MNEDAINRFIYLMQNINNVGLCFCEWASNNGEVYPEDVNWSYVATAEKILSDLLEVAHFAGIHVHPI